MIWFAYCENVKCLLMTVCHCPLLRMLFFRFCISCLLLMSVWRSPRNGTFPRTRWTTWMIVHCFLNLVHRNCSLLFPIFFCMCCWHAFLVMVMELCFLVCSLKWLVFNHVIYDGAFGDVFRPVRLYQWIRVWMRMSIRACILQEARKPLLNQAGFMIYTHFLMGLWIYD